MPNGYGAVSVFNTGSGAARFQFADINVSEYAELRFAYKSSSWMLFNGWAAYLHEPNKWVTVVMKQVASGKWNVSVYSTQDTQTFTYTGTKLSEILASWYNDTANVDFYFTDLRGIKKAQTNDKDTVKVSNLLFSKLYLTDSESVPSGFENVYKKYGLEKGNFSDRDISSYDRISFMIKLCGTFKAGDVTVAPTDDWISVELENCGSYWKVKVGDNLVFQRHGTSLKQILNDWHSDDENFAMYVTDMRGTWGSMKLNQIKAIAMSSDDKSDVFAMRAAERLVAELKKHAGIELLIEYHEDKTTFDPSKSYLVFGHLAEKLGITDVGLKNKTGYKINVTNGHLCVYSQTGDGMMNAVYGLLKEYFGLTYYTDNVFDIADTDPVFKNKDVLVNYDFEYNWAVDGAITKGATDASGNVIYNDDYMYRLGLSNAYESVGSGWHNFTTIVSQEKYGTNGTVAQHPEWFVTRTAYGTENFETLDIQNYCDAIATAAANELAALINASSRNVWSLSAPDYEDEKLNSDDYVTFMNKVAANLNSQINRKIELLLLAYVSTFEAPSVDLVPTDNVSFGVMVAPIESNYYYGFDNDTFTNEDGHTNKWFGDQIVAWSKKNCSLYVWNYSAYFDNYFVPLDTISNMQQRYKFYHENGITVIHDQGVGDKVTPDWSALKLYLKSELAKDVDADVDKLTDNFLKAYYGEAAAPYMKQLLQAQQAHYATIAANMKGGHVTQASLFDKKYWDKDMLATWYGYIESALDATSDETLRNRIQVEALTIRYMRQVLHTNIISKFSVVFVGATTKANDSLEQIITDAKALGIERFAESGGFVCDGKTIVDGTIDNLK